MLRPCAPSQAPYTGIGGKAARHPDATVTTTRPVFESVILGQRSLAGAIAQGGWPTEGTAHSVPDMWGALVDFTTNFPLVAPAG